MVVYDEVAAKEVRDRYKDDPNVSVLEKDHMKLNRFGNTRWTWSLLGMGDWKRKTDWNDYVPKTELGKKLHAERQKERQNGSTT